MDGIIERIPKEIFELSWAEIRELDGDWDAGRVASREARARKPVKSSWLEALVYVPLKIHMSFTGDILPLKVQFVLDYVEAPSSCRQQEDGLHLRKAGRIPAKRTSKLAKPMHEAYIIVPIQQLIHLRRVVTKGCINCVFPSFQSKFFPKQQEPKKSDAKSKRERAYQRRLLGNLNKGKPNWLEKGVLD